MNYTEDNKNPFSQDEFQGSENQDFNINQFSAQQSHFPQFETATPNIQDRIEAAKSNGWGAQIGNFLNSNKKKATIIVAIAILFAGGSYLSRRSDVAPQPNSQSPITSSENTSESSSIGTTEADKDKINVLDIRIGNDGEVIIDEEESAQDNISITKTASYGDGITHLARSAIKNYLLETGKNLSAEQKIYAEDYVQNRIGLEFLTVGQKLSFAKDLLKESVEKAEQLEKWQIENLKQYSSQVSLL